MLKGESKLESINLYGNNLSHVDNLILAEVITSTSTTTITIFIIIIIIFVIVITIFIIVILHSFVMSGYFKDQKCQPHRYEALQHAP